MPLRPITELRADTLLKRQTGGPDALDVQWYASPQEDMLGCIMPASESWRAILVGWDGEADYLMLTQSEGHDCQDAAYQWLTEQRQRLLPPPT